MSEKLASCPFCGNNVELMDKIERDSKGLVNVIWRIECPKCGVCTVGNSCELRNMWMKRTLRMDF